MHHLNKHKSKPKQRIQLVAVEDASCKEAKRADHITRRRRAQRLPEGGGLAGVRGPGQRRRQKQSLDPGLSLGWLGFASGFYSPATRPALAADRPLRRPPAQPCWSCPCWQGDPHPQRPWERNKGASRLSSSCAPVPSRRCSCVIPPCFPSLLSLFPSLPLSLLPFFKIMF